MQDSTQPRKQDAGEGTHTGASAPVPARRTSPLLRAVHTQRDPAATAASLREVQEGIVQAEHNLQRILHGLAQTTAPGLALHPSSRLLFTRQPASSP